MAEAQEPNQGQKQFQIQKIYVKDVSFETPNTPSIFTKEWKPEINLQLNAKHEKVSDGVFEVVLNLTVTAKIGEETAFLVEVQQAGIFTMIGFDEQETGPMLGAFCPNTLYPYAREAISDLVAKGGFPQLLLAPVNFDALYAQQVQQVQAKVTDPADAAH